MHLNAIMHTEQHCEAFDAVVQATESYPITHLGFLKFEVCTSGWIRGVIILESFGYRAWRMWPTRVRA